MNKPFIAITMGDPSGIGPEIVIRVVEDAEVRDQCVPVIIGDPEIFSRAIKLLKRDLSLEVISTPSEAGDDSGVVYVVSEGCLGDVELIPGKVDSHYGESAASCCRRSVEFTESGEVSAIVSTPFNKESFHMAGYDILDDMSYFEHCYGVSNKAYMVGEVAGIWITMVTYHISFRKIVDLITYESVTEKIRGLYKVMKAAEVTPIRIGVAGLNVHAGEGGMFGDEEIRVINPAIKDAQIEGYEVYGAIPPDSTFLKALDGDFNGLVFMYHDQANIGRKILGRDKPGVTLYMGMPSPVLTVPHGTAFDIAWKGKARYEMLLRATKMAAAMSN